MVTKLVMGILLIIAGALIVYGGLTQTAPNNMFPTPLPPATITNFEECKAAGYLIQYSIPERCGTPDGKSFVQELPTETVPNACEGGACEKKWADYVPFCNAAERYSVASGLYETIQSKCAPKSQTDCAADVQCEWR